MIPFMERVKRGDVLVGDGAMGTLLMSSGLESGQCPESFNLEQPEILKEIARLYQDAGADLIQTNTFGGSPLKLKGYGLADQAEEINRNAVLAVQQAVGDRAYISASCGPSGKLLKPFGDTDPVEMYDSFYRQLKVLIDTGVDAICIETMTDFQEQFIAIRAARSISYRIPIIATMTFDPTPRGFYTIMGVNIERAAQDLEFAGADIIGSNCGNGMEKMVEIAREFKKHTCLPLIIQANAGVPELKAGQPVYPETPEFMAEKARELMDAGVSIIGGCCGTTPDHIRALRRTIDYPHPN